MPGNALALQVPGACRRPQPDKAQINLARLQGAKLLGGSHVEEIQRNVRESTAKGSERIRQQLEVESGRIGNVQLAGFPSAQPLHRLDAFSGQGQNAPGIHQESPPFLSQCDLAFGAVQEPHADLLFQVMYLARERGLRQVQLGRGPGEI